MSYFVVGGLYKNTSFNEFVDDSKKERYGPFESYEDAKKYFNIALTISPDFQNAIDRLKSI